MLRSRIVSMLVVMNWLECIPLNQLHPPSGFCSFFSWFTACSCRWCRRFSSNNSTSFCICSVSFSASSIQGDASSKMDFSSAFCSSRESKAGVPGVFFHWRIAAAIAGLERMILLAIVFT